MLGHTNEYNELEYVSGNQLNDVDLIHICEEYECWLDDLNKRKYLLGQESSDVHAYCQPNLINNIPFLANHWLVEGEVRFKTTTRIVNSQGAWVPAFSFEVVDTSGSIRLTAFKKEHNLLLNCIQNGQRLRIGNAKLQPADPRFTRGKYEAHIKPDTSIQLIE